MPKKTAKKKVTKKVGRPTKFDNVDLDVVRRLILGDQFTDKEIAGILGATEKTFHNWKHKHKDFLQSVSDWKAEADKQIERSLSERANGYTVKETTEEIDNSGNEKRKTTYKQLPPDASSMIFWLKNRHPKRWRDKQEVEHSGTIDLAQKIMEARKRGSSD